MDPPAQLRIGGLLQRAENPFQARIGLLQQFRHCRAGGLFVVVVQQFQQIFKIIGHRLTAFPEKFL